MIGDTTLVVTVPSELDEGIRSIGCRTTVGVAVQLIHEAKHEIILAAPYITLQEDYFGGELIYQALIAGVRRGVRVRCFLSREGGELARSMGLFHTMPTVELFVPKPEIYAQNRLGSHAKTIIADANSAYIGSANLTTSGMHNQLEIGVLVHGGVAYQCHRFWDGLITEGFFVRLPVITAS